MNQLVLVTDTLLYRPGDVVTGHVWLDICTPTAGKSLRITLDGTEICERLGCNGQSEMFTNSLMASCDHLLWQANSTFPFGSYRTPFELSLPESLPGSFECSTLEGWKLSIAYTVKAYVVEDSDLADEDVIVVSQSSYSDPAIPTHPKKTQTFEVKQFLGFGKAQVTLECSLQEDTDSQLHTFSGQLTFDITIQNTSKTCRIVKRSLKLVQCLTLCGPCVLTESVMHFVNGNNFKPDPAGAAADVRPSTVDMNSNNMKAKRQNAAKSASEWQRILLSENICDKPYCSVILDLSQCDKSHYFESSVSGQTIKCQYQVVLSVTLDDDEVFSTQPYDIQLHSHSDTQHMPSNTEKLHSLKQQPMFHDAMAIDESLPQIDY